MKKYLLDTNICIFYLKGKYELDKKIEKVGQKNCFISEITVAELLYGAYHSKSQRHILEARQFIEEFAVIPFVGLADDFAKQKDMLTDKGQMIDDFDIMIGVSALKHGCIMATENIKHFSRIDSLDIENWINR